MTGTSSRPRSSPRAQRPVRGGARPLRAPGLASALLALLVGAVAVPPRLPARPEGPDLLEEIRERARSGGRAEALGLIEQFLKETPRSPLAPQALLLAASLESDAERAAARWERIAADFPASPECREALLALGRHRFACGRLDGAVEVLETLLDEKKPPEPLTSEARFWLLLARAGSGEPPDALAGLLRDVREEPWSWWGHVALGQEFLLAGNPERAADLFVRASGDRGEEGPGCAALFGLGEAYRAKGLAERAREAYEEVARRCPRTIEGALAARRLEPAPRADASRPPSGDAATGGDSAAPEEGFAVEIARCASREEAERIVEAYAARRSEEPYVVLEPATAADSAAAPSWRVLLGPFRDRAPAEDLSRDLREEGFQSVVVRR